MLEKMQGATEAMCKTTACTKCSSICVACKNKSTCLRLSSTVFVDVK